jgi:hypothetical protein
MLQIAVLIAADFGAVFTYDDRVATDCNGNAESVSSDSR